MPTRRLAASLTLAALLVPGAHAQGSGAHLFRVVGPRDEVTIGLTEAELQRLGTGPAVERIARALVANGQIIAGQYSVGRAADGGTRYATTRRITILRNDTSRIESYTAAVPVAPPPAE